MTSALSILRRHRLFTEEIRGYAILVYKDRAASRRIEASWLTHEDGVTYEDERAGGTPRPDTRKPTLGDGSVIRRPVAEAPEISPDGAIR
jgi:hypothetical protein